MWLDSKAVNCPQKWGNFNPGWDVSINPNENSILTP